jgi:hypothetical protein
MPVTWDTQGIARITMNSTFIGEYDVHNVSNLYIHGDGGEKYEFLYIPSEIQDLAADAHQNHKSLDLRSRIKIKPIAVSSVAHVHC